MKKKKIIIAIVAICLVIGTVVGVAVYQAQIPKVGDIYDRVVELVESSYRLNTVFYGAGLPVYAEGSDYAEFSHLYYGTSVPLGYEVVSNYSPYFSVDAIKADAEKVYSKNFLEKVLYPMAFDGYAIEDGAGGSMFSHAKFYEANNWIYRAKTAENYLKNGLRVYDYSTMKVIRPSNAKECLVSMDSWLPSNPSDVKPTTIHLVLQDDGIWYLDSFSG